MSQMPEVKTCSTCKFWHPVTVGYGAEMTDGDCRNKDAKKKGRLDFRTLFDFGCRFHEVKK